MEAIARLLRHLRGTVDYGIKYSGFPSVLEGYNDANWISNSNKTKSSTYYVLTLGGHTVAWRSARKTFIAGSTMESEFVAPDMVEWLKNLLANIPLGMKPTPSVSIHCDSQSAIVVTKNKTYNGKNRHIQLKHNVVMQ